MKLKLKKLNIDAGRSVAFLHTETAKEFNIHVGDRIEIFFDRKKIISVVDFAKGLVGKEEIALSNEAFVYGHLKNGDMMEINLPKNPTSSSLIARKMSGFPLQKSEIYVIIRDILNNALTDAEIAYFVSAVAEKGMSLQETIYLTEAMYKTGHVLKWPSSYKVADKHSIGGIPGNRTTPILVSICVASGIIMPKTSSRAITSASGTADTLETITKVSFSVSELKRIVKKIGACLAWGGSLGLAPADDKLIRVEKLIHLDPESQLIASILAKKLAVGSKYILIDIPYGEGAKVSKREAEKLRKKFMLTGKHFNLHIKIILTDGSQPIGNGIGPVLEMQDIIKVLRREKDAPKDLENKSLILSGNILEMLGKAKKGFGFSKAKEILNSGLAFKKFNEIINQQGRKNYSLQPAKQSYSFKAKKNGKIKRIGNKEINSLARILGCPVDKGAGIYLFWHKNDVVKKGITLLTLYSESKNKLKEAISYFNLVKPILY